MRSAMVVAVLSTSRALATWLHRHLARRLHSVVSWLSQLSTRANSGVVLRRQRLFARKLTPTVPN